MRRSGRSQDALRPRGGVAKLGYRCLSQLAEVSEGPLEGEGEAPV